MFIPELPVPGDLTAEDAGEEVGRAVKVVATGSVVVGGDIEPELGHQAPFLPLVLLLVRRLHGPQTRRDAGLDVLARLGNRR